MQIDEQSNLSVKISFVNSKGVSLGKFDINTVNGFEDFAKKSVLFLITRL